jgi:hypothetical protein
LAPHFESEIYPVISAAKDVTVNSDNTDTNAKTILFKAFTSSRLSDASLNILCVSSGEQYLEDWR